MTARPIFLPVSAILLAVFTALPSGGQERTPAGPAAEAAGPDSASALGDLLSRPLEIRNEGPMPLREFVHDLLAGMPTDRINVLIDPRVADLEVPRLEMKRVSMRGLMEVLDDVVGFRFEAHGPQYQGHDAILVFAAAQDAAPADKIVPRALDRTGEPGGPVPLNDVPELRVISLAELDDDWGAHVRRIGELVAQVVTGPGDGKAEDALMFSRPARLLMVRLDAGRAEEVVRIVRGYVESARVLGDRTRERTRPLLQRIGEVESEILTKGRDLANDHPVMARLRAELDELRMNVREIEVEGGMR